MKAFEYARRRSGSNPDGNCGAYRATSRRNECSLQCLLGAFWVARCELKDKPTSEALADSGGADRRIIRWRLKFSPGGRSMRTLLQLAAVLALLAFSVGTAVLVWDAHNLALDAGTLLEHANTSLAALDSTVGDIGETTINVRGVLTEAQNTAENLRLASASEAAYWNATAKQTSLAARDMRQLIARTDRELNDKFLPDFDEQLQQTSTAAQFSFESLTKASDAITFQVNDPAIPQTLEAFNRAAQSFADASAKTDDALGHVDHTLAYYDKQLTTPLGFWKTLGKTVLSTGSQAGNIYGGFIK